MEERFWSKVARTDGDGCWLWLAAKQPNGYGSFQIAAGRRGYAHRIAWELTNGPIPVGEGYHGMCVLHRCDVRACVNPAHLFLGTHQDNVRDMVRKGRSANAWVSITHCAKGHPYSPENTTFTSEGWRKCIACRGGKAIIRATYTRDELKTRCQNGHVRTKANTYIRPDNGRRSCLICRRAIRAAYSLRRGLERARNRANKKAAAALDALGRAPFPA